MRYALIDNSTLTSIQRLFGEIPVSNTAIIDSDILAFDNYIQAILFYDNIIAIDDYIPKYRESRKKKFPEIRFINRNIFEYSKFQEEANSITEQLRLRIKAGKINSKEYKAFFDELSMKVTFTWDQSTSEHYLTQKLLIDSENKPTNQKEFDKVHSAIIAESFGHFGLTESEKNITPKLYDLNGFEINAKKSYGGLSKPLLMFSNGLNWISNRTSFYILTADYLYADAFLSPLRQKFTNSILSTIARRSTGKYSPIIDDFSSMVVNSLDDIKSPDEGFRISSELPLFSAYFANKTKDICKIIPEVYEVRETIDFRECRNKLRELNKILSSGEHSKHVKDLNKLKNEVEKSLLVIRGKYNVDKKGVNASTLAMIWNSTPLSQYLKVPKLNIQIESLDFLNQINSKKGFTRVCRNIIEDLVSVERLGSLYDILAAKVKLKENASYYAMKTEEEKYKHATSSWKIPMK